MEERKNLFFYPNVCHVCKVFPRDYELKRCGGCRMVFYCNNEHQKIHWPRHKDFCKVVRQVLYDSAEQKLFLKQLCSDRKDWTQKQMNRMLLVGLNLKRRLEPYEKEMFKFAKVCAVCYNDDLNYLEDCKSCASASFCTIHKNDSTHKDICSLLKLCFELDITGREYKIPLSNLDIHSTEYALLELTANMTGSITQDINNMKEEKEIGEMPSFCTINSAVNKEELPISERSELAYITEIYTRPFCILYTVKYLHCYEQNNMIIHVVGANMIEMANLEVWEILLHTLPMLMTIKVIFIGPELPGSNTINVDICQRCLTGKKDMRIDAYNLLYKDYEACPLFEKPNVIIAYNAGIHEYEDLSSGQDTWAESMHSIAKQNCPFVVTSYTSQEAQCDINRIATILGSHIKPVYSDRCPYSSVRPHRDFETGGIYYQNQYITIYDSLNK